MTINGFIVMDQGGIAIYSNTVGMNMALDPLLVGGFLNAIQSFAREFDGSKESYIKELTMQNVRIMYRQIEFMTFVGMVDQKADSKTSELILEYLILAFLSKFRGCLKENALLETSQFCAFNEAFEQHRDSKEKDLKKWLESSDTSLLQGVLNKMINYFPISELLTIDSKNLTVIGKKIIWVSMKIKPTEEENILNELKKKMERIYGPGMYESLEKDVKNKIISLKLVA